jgi:uncharacterized repeat protein (TIGR03803 family)
LTVDSKGVAYGTTYSGGNQNCDYKGSGDDGCGTAFRLRPPRGDDREWGEQILHRFNRTPSDGGNPMAGLTIDSKGSLYGTTLNGGPGGGGIVFRLAPPSKKTGHWKETILYGLSKNGDGLDPESSLVFDSKGNLYGTANDSLESYHGTVFELTPREKNGPWSFNLLYGFAGSPDGAFPAARLIFDKQGNLYSTTTQGGTGACPGGCGTVFEVSP